MASMRVALWRLAMVGALAALVVANGVLAGARRVAKWVGAGADRAEIGWLLCQARVKLNAQLRTRAQQGGRRGD